MSGPNQCGLPVDYVVRHPYWLGDYYCVCERHLDWAKRCMGKGPITVVKVVTEHGYREIASGCVYWDAKKHSTPKNRLPLNSSNQ